MQHKIESNTIIESLTTGDSNDDEVFHGFQTPPSEPRLKRRNAIRLKHRPNIQSLSEPRVTRLMLHSNSYRNSISNPTSPTSVALNRVQNLENVLNPIAPIVPEVVDLGPRVQNLYQALENFDNENRRRSQRIRSNIDAQGKVDYKMLHKHGRRH